MSYIASFIVAAGIDSVPEFEFNFEDSGVDIHLTKLFKYYRLDKVVIIIDDVFPNSTVELFYNTNVLLTSNQIFLNMPGVPQFYYPYHKNTNDDPENLILKITGSDGSGSGRILLYITRYQ